MLAALSSLLAAVAAQAATSTLEVRFEGVRNSRGLIQACLMQEQAKFPDCAADRHAVRLVVSAGATSLIFEGLVPGEYALALFHDENANSRLDTFLGIPKEGFGFSRNPKVRFGAPRFDEVSIRLTPGLNRTRVRLQYLLKPA